MIVLMITRIALKVRVILSNNDNDNDDDITYV